MGLIVDPNGEPFEAPGEEIDEDGDDRRVISREELRRMLEDMIAQNKGTIRNTRSQILIDRLVKACLQEGEIELGCAIGLLHGARVAGQQALFLQVLLQLCVTIKSEGELLDQRCRVCGCTNDRACPGGCSWVEFDLCSRCAAEAHVV